MCTATTPSSRNRFLASFNLEYIIDSHNPSAAQLQLKGNHDLKQGELLIATDCQHAALFHGGLGRARIPHVGLPHLAFPQDDEAYDVTLYKSTLDRAGAVYKSLHTVRLGTIAAERS